MAGTLKSAHDFTHLVGPLTEESLVLCLQSRFYSRCYQTLLGPQLVCVNDFVDSPAIHDLNRVDTITSDETGQRSPPPASHPFIDQFVANVVSQHKDSSHPQVVLLSGENGSGKTFWAVHVLKQLWTTSNSTASGNDAGAHTFHKLTAAFTTLHSMITAGTSSNPNSSRVGLYVENATSDGVLTMPKIYCLFADTKRITNMPRGERNFHIFYQMLAGLSVEEKVKLHLDKYETEMPAYLDKGNLPTDMSVCREDFAQWKTSLAAMGIPLSDVLRVLASVMLLGNLQFIEGRGQELDVIGNKELKSVAALLGVSGVALYRGFCTKTRISHGRACKTITSAIMANSSRDSLARALYHRTINAILSRINNMNQESTTTGIGQPDDVSSGYQQYMNRPDLLNPSLSAFVDLSRRRRISESFIGVLDLFGFETAETNGLEQMCINLCAEAMQHYYNTHVFQCPMDALKEEGLYHEVHVNYFDNTPVIELLSAQTSGLLSVLDSPVLQETLSSRDYLQEIRHLHTANNYFFDPLPKNDNMFGIRHFTSRVVYDASSFPTTNQDGIADDIVQVFSQHSCNFGFVSYLFSSELKMVDSQGITGTVYRTFSSHHHSESHLAHCCSFATDFQSELENILKCVSTARPHFIRCIKSNDQQHPKVFDCESVTRQVRSLQLAEAIQLMAGGLPHRLRYKVFNGRYRAFLTSDQAIYYDKPRKECKAILQQFLRDMDNSQIPYTSTQWHTGRKHIFFSEGTRQCLEGMRREKLLSAARVIQIAWRRCRHRMLRHKKKTRTQAQAQQGPVPVLPKGLKNLDGFKICSPRPELPPKGEKIEKIEPGLLSYICKTMDLDMLNPPPLPAKRNYSIHGNVQISFPQSRCMRVAFPEGDQQRPDGSSSLVVLSKGEIVTVLGPSGTQGHLMVQKEEHVYHVPYTFMDIHTHANTTY